MTDNAPETIEQRERRWRHTRHMAWIAILSGCLFPGLAVFTDSSQLGQIAMPFYLFVASVVGVFVGFSTAEDKWRRQR